MLADLSDRGKLRDHFTARDVFRNGWTLLASPEQVRDALEVLTDHGWLQPYEEKGGGRPTTRYRIHPDKPRAA